MSVRTRSPCKVANLSEAAGDSRDFNKTEISAGEAVAQPSPPLDALHSSTKLRDASCWKEHKTRGNYPQDNKIKLRVRLRALLIFLRDSKASEPRAFARAKIGSREETRRAEGSITFASFTLGKNKRKKITTINCVCLNMGWLFLCFTFSLF